MNAATASLNSYRQPPRKVRVVADLVRGKSVEDALTILEFVPKRAGLPLRKLIASAYANAGKEGGLIVKSITVDAGETLKRRMPRARGSAYPIKKRTSHVKVTLGTKK